MNWNVFFRCIYANIAERNKLVTETRAYLREYAWYDRRWRCLFQRKDQYRIDHSTPESQAQTADWNLSVKVKKLQHPQYHYIHLYYWKKKRIQWFSVFSAAVPSCTISSKYTQYTHSTYWSQLCAVAAYYYVTCHLYVVSFCCISFQIVSQGWRTRGLVSIRAWPAKRPDRLIVI